MLVVAFGNYSIDLLYFYIQNIVLNFLFFFLTLSNKENHSMTIRMAILVVKRNIPCNDNNHWY